MEMVWVKSKITIPQTVPNAIERNKLISILSNNRMKRLILVKAPAGYGKTTLLSQWFDQISEHVAWFSIDCSDNEPKRFLKYLIHTLSVSDIEQKVSPLIDNSCPYEFIVDALLYELELYRNNIHIVFDRFDIIQNRSIHKILIRLIEYLPNNVRIYVTTRTNLSLPFTLWRMKEWMLEVGRNELSFDFEEIQKIFAIHSFENQTNLLKQILIRTEGCPAFIQLILFASDSLLEEESSDKLIDNASSFIYEYFIQETLDPLPLPTQDFLIRTSILNRLEPDVCNKITNRSDSLNILIQLENNGIYVVSSKEQQPIYRYHILFKEALQQELRVRYSRDKIISIYRDAATILCEKGDNVLAIGLAINGELYEMAHEWIQTYLVEIFAEGQTELFGQWVQQLRSVNYPVDINSLVLYITTLFSMHEIDKANEIIEELFFKQDSSKWMDGFQFIAVTKIFEIINAYVAFMKDGNIEKAKKGLMTRVNVREEKSHLYHISLKYNLFEPRILRTFAGAKGKLLPVEKMDELIEVLCQSEIKDRIITGVTYGVLAELLYETNDLERASKELEKALKYGHNFHDPGLFIPMYLLKARIFMAKKQYEDARILLANVTNLNANSYWTSLLYIMKSLTYLFEGNVSYAKLDFLKSSDYMNYKIAAKQPFYLLTQARILLADNYKEEALKIAVRVKESAVQENQIVTIIEAGILEAVCNLSLGKEDSALFNLHGTIEFAAPYGYIRPFIEEEAIFPLLNKYYRIRQNDTSHIFNSIPLTYVKKVLRNIPSLGENLTIFTPRERDVLWLLAQGATNNQIANQLVLSEGTVRVYLTEIYAKIGVTSRMKAIKWAIEKLGY